VCAGSGIIFVCVSMYGWGGVGRWVVVFGFLVACSGEGCPGMCLCMHCYVLGGGLGGGASRSVKEMFGVWVRVLGRVGKIPQQLQ
jgi:hypothetical protein